MPPSYFLGDMNEILQQKIKMLPEKSGVYVMLNEYGQVIYVGKAKVLKNRVKQYFYLSVKTEKVMAMVANIADFYYIITKNEYDALSLENNLIKKYKPKYNILLKDDKTYPYIKVNLSVDFPRFEITRKITKDKSKYFGPFMNGVSVKDILEIINTCYALRSCKNMSATKRECLNYHIGLCKAPCTKKISKEEYAVSVKKGIDFLNGNDNDVEQVLLEKMNNFAQAEEFELAISFREKLKMLSKIREKKITALSRDINCDIVAFATDNIYSAVNVLFTRKGIMQGSKCFSIDAVCENESEAISQFLRRYYTPTTDFPNEIVLSAECSDSRLLEEYFAEISGKTVNIITPNKGVRKQLADMALGNAKDYLEKTVGVIEHKQEMTFNACERLGQLLHLKRYPRRIECYDISNISGVDKVGSMVVMIDGEKDTSEYRRFMIKTVEGANDYASHQEMLTRRLEKLNSDEKERFPMPDLIVIDGGKGQLSATKEVLDKFGLDIDIIALAERNEEIFVVGDSNPIVLSKRDYVLKMLQRLRDEAHRFAITYFRSLHKRNMIVSKLDSIDGVGKLKKKALLQKFKSVEKIATASVEELCQVEGVGLQLATTIYNYFRGKN